MAYTDAFTDSSGTSLPSHDATWTNIGDSNLSITSNQAGPSAGGACSDLWDDTFATAHYAQAVHKSGNYAGPAIRMAASSDFFYCFASQGDNSYPGESIAGSLSDWDSGQASVSADDVVRIEVDPSTSTTIHYKVNGSTVQTYTGKNNLSGGQGGLAAYGDGAGYVDDWEAGDVSSGAVTINCAAGTLAVAGQQADAQPGAVSIGCAAGSATISGQSVTVDNVPPAVTINCASGSMTLNGEQADVQPGAVSIACGAGALTVSAQQADAQPGAVSIGCTVGSVTVSGQSASVSSPPPGIVITCTVGTLSLSGQQADAQPGDVNIGCTVGSVTISGQQVDAQPGAVGIACAAGSLTFAGQSVTISSPPPGLVVNCAAGSLAFSGQQVYVQPGAVSIACAVSELLFTDCAVSIQGCIYFGTATLSNSRVDVANVSDSLVEAAVLSDALVEDADMEFEP